MDPNEDGLYSITVKINAICLNIQNKKDVWIQYDE